MLPYLLRKPWGRLSGSWLAEEAPALEKLEGRCLLSGHHGLAHHLSSAPARHRAPHLHARPTSKTVHGSSPIMGIGSIPAPPVGRTFSIVVGSFDGDAADALGQAISGQGAALSTVVTVAWGDGTSSPAVLEQNADGDFDVVATHKYAAAGTFSVGVVVTQGPPLKPGKPIALFSTRVIGLLFSTAIVS